MTYGRAPWMVRSAQPKASAYTRHKHRNTCSERDSNPTSQYRTIQERVSTVMSNKLIIILFV